jgi:hypothetical protein
MKKAILLLLAAIGLFSLPASKVFAQAQVVNFHDEFDLSGTTTTTCDGTPVTIDQGTFCADIHYAINKNRTNISIHYTVKGTGTDQAGNTYNIMRHTVIKEQPNVTDSGYTAHVNATFQFVSQGSAPNFSGHSQYSYTFNPDGTFTVHRSRFTTSCD